MAVNRGKSFEGIIQACFERIPEVNILRIHDQTTGYAGSKNPCDFIVYHKPYLFVIECKSIHGNTFSIYSKSRNPKKPHDYGNITNFQWEQLLKMSQIKGVYAGVLVWFIDKDETIFFDINLLKRWRDAGHKSIHSYPEWIEYVETDHDWCYLVGRKKRVYWDYNMVQFLRDMEKRK